MKRPPGAEGGKGGEKGVGDQRIYKKSYVQAPSRAKRFREGRKGRAGMREQKEVGDSSEERRKERQGEEWKHPGEDWGRGLKRWEEERSAEKRG